MKVLIFSVEGAYARFRCSYTTTSALTYSLIHPIAIKGMLGAIMGIEYHQLYEYTKNMKIGIQVLNPINKDTQSFNLIPQTGGNNAANFQSRVEFLRDVKYRIFVTDDFTKLSSLANTIKTKTFQFTPYLGCSEHIAKLKFEGLIDANHSDENYVNTVIPRENLIFDENYKLFLDRIPVKNNEIREYIEYMNVVFSSESPLKVNCKLIKVGDYNVYFI